MIKSGRSLGWQLYLYAVRVNLGTLRRDENALWSLGPHDASIVLHLLDDQPQTVSARGGAYLQKGIHDVVFVNLQFKSGVMAQIQLSWLDPRKERRVTVVGSRKMLEFDDVHPVEKLRVYDKGYERPPVFSEFSEYLSIRNGDIHIPQVPLAEPLEQEARHFLECVAQNRRPLSDGASGRGRGADPRGRAAVAAGKRCPGGDPAVEERMGRRPLPRRRRGLVVRRVVRA
jgi:predicted dehydrogenase